MIYTKAPAKLRSIDQWVNWRYVGAERRKMPLQPDGTPASSTNPATWYSFATCVAVASKFSGVGFVFTADDGFVGVDLDNAIDPSTKRAYPWAAKVIRALNSYTEVSPSGAGYKIWVHGSWGGSRNSKAIGSTPGSKIEVFDHSRYFTVTGQRVGGVSQTIEHRQNELDRLAKWMRPPKRTPPTPVVRYRSTDIEGRARAFLEKCVEPSIEGSNGSRPCFYAAQALVNGYGFSLDEALPLMVEWSAANATPPWPEHQLLHKLESAAQRPDERGVGYLLREGA